MAMAGRISISAICKAAIDSTGILATGASKKWTWEKLRARDNSRPGPPLRTWTETAIWISWSAAFQYEPGVFLDENGKPIPPYRDWGLAVMFRDINGDGAPDIYVCNDFASPDRVWVNTGKGTFRAINPFMLRHTSRSSMGIDFADIDRDGHDDFIVVDMLG